MNLTSPVENIPGVGPISARELRERGIATVFDVLRTLPLRYTDFTVSLPLANARVGVTAAFSGIVQECVVERTHRKFMTLTWVRIKDSSVEVWSVWFNQ